MISKAKGCKVSSKLIKRIAAKCEITADNPLGLDELKTLRANAHKKYRKMKPTTRHSRDIFIDVLADALEEVYGVKKASSVRSLKLREEQSTTSLQVKVAFNTLTNGSIDKLKIPDPENPGTYIFTEDKDVMEESLIAANKENFLSRKILPFEKNRSSRCVAPMVKQRRVEKFY